MSDVIYEMDNEVMVVPLFLDFMLERVLRENLDICKRFITSLLDINIDSCKIRGYDDSFGNEDGIIIDIMIDDIFLVTLELDSTNLIDGNYGVIKFKFDDVSDSNNIGEDIIIPYSIKTNSIYLNNNYEYVYYLDYYRNLYYNDNVEKREKDYWLALLSAKSFKELNDIFRKFLDNETRMRLIIIIFCLSIDEDILNCCEELVL